MNYQKIETFILNNISFDNYDYVIFDESQYYFSDSTFNIKTDLSFKRMIKDNTICKILLTATPRILENYFKSNDIIIDYKYELSTDYSYIRNITAFSTYESIDSIIEDIPQEEQILLFTSAKRALEISKKHNGAFICSQYNQYYDKYVKDTENEEERTNIIENGEFKNHLLCITTALDNGVNVKEGTPVKHIIIDIFDPDEFIQCLGRKRIGEGESINLYFYNYKDNRRINGFKSKITNSLERADYLLDHGQEEYVKHKFKNERFTDTRIIDDILNTDNSIKKVVNECMYTKYQEDLILYNAILSKKNNFNYKNMIATALSVDKTFILELETTTEIMSLEELLKEITGQKLYKDKQKELIEFIDLRQDRKQLKSPNSFNASFKEQGIPYVIDVPKTKTYRDENGKVKREKSYWIVGKIIYNVDK
ncbi:DEAD/DEAH box helicase family protein [Clostridium arbusti]|uniref:DEAD/DEAH box helicase family protein n=1 Tax=Clostridium arbusti TaxID=1137848 RepID=UPI00028825DA|nr:DEAD/DEAH box helicase family protein [Clostridium arbusti]